MFTINMKNSTLTSNTLLLDMSVYRLPNNKDYSRIFDAVPKIVNETGFNIFDYYKVFEDEETKRIIRKGETIGCFYIESPGMRSLLRRTDCHTFEMLTAVSSVIRPGVAESGMMKEFVGRHKDPKRRKYLVPEMEKYLGETYGVMVYQEDVIKVAHHIVGLTLEEADLLRRAMSGKMRSHKAMNMIIDKFFACCIEKGYSEEVSEKLWKQIESFAGYAFCKAHSASFALLSFQVAYLKAHYPAEFMAAVLSNQGGYYSAAVYISEAQRLGIKVLLPSVNKSVYEYTGSGKEIRIGLMAIKNLEKNVIDKIIVERERRREYLSLADFLKRTQLTYEQTEILIKCGAMDCLGQTRPTLLRLADIYFSHRKLIFGSGAGLFEDETIKLEKEVVTQQQFSADEMCVHEYEAFGYMVTKHPLEFFADETGLPHVVKASEINEYHNRIVKMIGWYMTSKRIKTSKGEIMKFLSLEDLSGTFEAVIFPKAYQKYAELTISMGPYLVEGRVDAMNGSNIIVENLSVLAAGKAGSITQKDRTSTDFFGDVEKPPEFDEFHLVNSLDREKLIRAYL
jgi:DNA polymerase III alpha subunit